MKRRDTIICHARAPMHSLGIASQKRIYTLCPAFVACCVQWQSTATIERLPIGALIQKQLKRFSVAGFRCKVHGSLSIGATRFNVGSILKQHFYTFGTSTVCSLVQRCRATVFLTGERIDRTWKALQKNARTLRPAIIARSM